MSLAATVEAHHRLVSTSALAVEVVGMDPPELPL
jgi:hypothetical protein